jgi:hypothetical protein
MGSLAARGVAQSDRASVWQAFIVHLFPGVAIRRDFVQFLDAARDWR